MRFRAKRPGFESQFCHFNCESQVCRPSSVKLGMMVIKIISAQPTSGACDVNQNKIADVMVLVISKGLY